MRTYGEMFDEMLDECYDPVDVAGYCFPVSLALAELDPIAYRQGFLDYADSMGWGDVDTDDEPSDDEEGDN